MAVLSMTRLKHTMLSLPGWHVEAGKLLCNLEFADFCAAMEFVSQVAAMAERANHHPDIDIRYNKVKFSLVSHDEGGITDRDIALASEIEAAFMKKQ